MGNLIYHSMGISAYHYLGISVYHYLSNSAYHFQYRDNLNESPIRTALITARNAPAHERVIRTLRVWGVEINEVFFMGGLPKDKILKAFKPHIFFDDQLVHCEPASRIVPTGQVPYKKKKSK